MIIVSKSVTTFPAQNTTSEGGGTARWMAPELLLPEQFGLPQSLPSKQSDVYALGMIIYEVSKGFFLASLIQDVITR
jgi:serine/threonine protein kinase